MRGGKCKVVQYKVRTAAWSLRGRESSPFQKRLCDLPRIPILRQVRHPFSFRPADPKTTPTYEIERDLEPASRLDSETV